MDNEQEQQRVERAEPGQRWSIRPSADLIQAIVAASADGILAIDEHGTVRACNQAAQDLLARPADQLIGAPFGYPLVTGEASDIDVRLPDGIIQVVEMRMAATTWQGAPCPSPPCVTSHAAGRPNATWKKRCNSRTSWSR